MGWTAHYRPADADRVRGAGRPGGQVLHLRVSRRHGSASASTLTTDPEGYLTASSQCTFLRPVTFSVISVTGPVIGIV